jgi:hypothetical protein
MYERRGRGTHDGGRASYRAGRSNERRGRSSVPGARRSTLLTRSPASTQLGPDASVPLGLGADLTRTVVDHRARHALRTGATCGAGDEAPMVHHSWLHPRVGDARRGRRADLARARLRAGRRLRGGRRSRRRRRDGRRRHGGRRARRRSALLTTARQERQGHQDQRVSHPPSVADEA